MRTDEPRPWPMRRHLPRTPIPWWIGWVVFFALLGWIVATIVIQPRPPGDALPYSAFRSQVSAGKIARVTISGQQVEGDWRTADDPPTPSDPSTGQVAVGSNRVSDFHTVVPPMGDPTLLPLLEAKDVQIAVIPTPTNPWWPLLLPIALSAVVLGAMVLFSRRRGVAGQPAAPTLGPSHVRVYSADRSRVTFHDVAGEDEAKAELQDIVQFLRNPLRYYRVGARLPRGILLIGPPGTGKTLLARAVAGEAGVPFFSISASEFVEVFVGLGASRVRELFAQVKEAAPSIVFVDEIDAVGRQREAQLGGGSGEREQTLNQLLVEMDGFAERQQVIVLAATNRPDVLDPALLRPGRFDRQVAVGLPDRTGRLQILSVHCAGKPLSADVDLSSVARATPGFSGADLANLVNEAALQAARDDAAEIRRSDFELALDKIKLGIARPHLSSLDERRLVAYHEAGHALVAVCTPGADPVQRVTIIPRGRALGLTEQRPTDERLNYPRSYLTGRLAVLLGGRAAEELVFHDPTTGAESDLQEATQLARRMVGSWGMDDRVGPIHFADDGAAFAGRGLMGGGSYADATVAQLDRAAAELIQRARERAMSLIAAHRVALDDIVALLLEHETIGGDDLRRILAAAATSSAPPVVEPARAS